MPLEEKQKGDLVESMIADLLTWSSDGNLTCYLPSTDIDGIDLVVNKKMEYKPMFLQIKSRYVLSGHNDMFMADVKLNTFNAHQSFYLLFVYINPKEFTIERMWLVPSNDFVSMTANQSAANGKKRFIANPRDTATGEKTEYKVRREDLADLITSIIDELL